MTDIKKKQIIRTLKWLIVAILAYEAYSCTNTFLEIDSCLDSGKGVWDYDQKRCRHDCLKWTEREKCIPLDADCDKSEQGCRYKNEHMEK